MVREDLIDGAVTFLQDPSVSSAPIEQKLAFLRSKNLTQEEIDISLSRTGNSNNASAQQQQPYPQQYRSGPPPGQYGSGYYGNQGGYWGPPPPMEPPQRDWRDWFIVATVASGAAGALWWTAKRYIYPLVAPPTPPQLEQDKAAIDSSFEKAFALLEQVAADTAELKSAEEARKERLDAALGEVEAVIGRMKEAHEARESEAKRLAREMDDLRASIPAAIEKDKEVTDGRLRDLATEMKSLKTLVQNRMAGGSVPSNTSASSIAPTAPPASAPTTNGAADSNSSNGIQTGSAAPQQQPQQAVPASSLPERSSSSSPYGRLVGGKAAIPSWQLAAKKRTEEQAVNGSSSSLNEGSQ